MRKVIIVFCLVILVEIVLSVLFYSLGKVYPAEDPYSFMNPFGFGARSEYCDPYLYNPFKSITEEDPCWGSIGYWEVYGPYPPFYITVDLLAITIVIFIVYSINKKNPNNKE